MYANGKMVKDIVEYMNSRGVKSSYNKPLTKTTVTAMLKNTNVSEMSQNHTGNRVKPGEPEPREVKEDTLKTVQEYLRAADRSRLLDAIVYDTICDPILLLEYQDKTILEIQNAVKSQMNDLIEHLLSLESIPTDCKVLYMAKVSSTDSNFNSGNLSLCLIDLNKIRKDIYVPGYSFELTDW